MHDEKLVVVLGSLLLGVFVRALNLVATTLSSHQAPREDNKVRPRRSAGGLPAVAITSPQTLVAA